jgi:phage terminase large subunit-like protein
VLELAESADYVYDPAAAARVVNFIERYCKHYEGAHAGEPFKLEPIQRRIVGDLFGWKSRATGFRRFTDCYLEAAVGAGKSPLLAAIGLYGLTSDGEQGAQVYSLAGTYGQARVVFEAAKRMAAASPQLDARLRSIQFEIQHPASNSVWRIVSGKGPGAGCRPSMILADEVHDWQNGGAYQALRDRMIKRRQPLLIAATNAGESQESFCWTLREKAVAALEGTGDPAIYPVIWSADPDAATDDPAAWRQANPLIGVTIKEEKIRALCVEMMKDPDELLRFRRLYLGVWPTTSAGRWLDLAQWDAASGPIAPAAGSPLYIGLDLSQGDDLCAAAFVWPTPDTFYVDARFWLPRETAERYAQANGIPYLEWAAANHITLLDEPTISDAARVEIASELINVAGAWDVRAVAFDRYKADGAIATMERAGLPCVPVPQGYSLSPGCFELERRIKERSILLYPNPVLRFCAGNVEVKQDDRGNIWPVKPNARGKYAGQRSAKIDGVTALVTALTEARRHTFPKGSQKFLKGAPCILV